MKNVLVMCTAILLVLIAVLGCNKLTTVGNVDLYQADGAAKAAAAIKEKIGTGKISVISGEVRKDSMKVTIQAPDNPKNMDEYTYEKAGEKTTMLISKVI